MTENKALIAFNRGRLSKLGMARNDLKRYPFAAQAQTNWMPRALGSMMLRPGLGYIDDTFNDNKAYHVPFIFSLNDMAVLEMTDQTMRVRVNDHIITRPAVTTTITNPNFTTDLAGWTNGDEAGATSSWQAGSFMGLVGNGVSRAIESQEVTVAGANIGVEHAVRFVIARGNIALRIGTVLGDDSYVHVTTLGAGTHSLSFTPAGNFFIEVTSAATYTALIKSINIEAAGAMSLPTPYAIADLNLLRTDQSADVIFMACDKVSGGIGYAQYKVERRATRSWSVVQYLVDDGPFLLDNIDDSISMVPGALDGDTTLTSTNNYFKPGHVGALFRITSIGQAVQQNLGGGNQFSDPIEVTGVGGARTFNFSISGVWVGTVTLQQSVGDVGNWTDAANYTNNLSSPLTDGLDNQTIYYRLGFKTGNYVSGSANVTLQIATGGLTGIGRVTDYTNPTQVNISVLKPFGSTVSSTLWAEGTWSNVQGFPTAVALNEGRLWWAGRDSIIASVSDAFGSFDDSVIGDSGPINRTIGSGPVDRINWLVPLLRFALGGQMAEHFIFSDALDAPLTPTNNNIRAPSNKGSASVAAVKLNTNALFVDKSGTRIYTVSYDNVYQSYPNEELTVYCPEIGTAGFIKIVLQQQPDVRLHGLRADGTVAVLVYDKTEEVQCWIDVVTPGAGGFVEDIVILPGLVEDQIYYSTRRTIGGATKRFYEKWALEGQCVGGTLNMNLDSYVTFTSVMATNIITGLDHLEGQEVVVWADGKDLSPFIRTGTYPAFSYNPKTYLVTGGQVTLDAGVTVQQAVVGLFYDGVFQGTKLTYAAALGTAMTQTKINDYLGLVLKDTHSKGILYGSDLDHMQEMPEVEDGAVVPYDTIWSEYDKEMHEFDSEWDTDPRIWLRAMAPRPCTVLGMVVSIETNDKS